MNRKQRESNRRNADMLRWNFGKRHACNHCGAMLRPGEGHYFPPSAGMAGGWICPKTKPKKEPMDNHSNPGLYAACREIAYDNGMINRYQPEAEAIDEMLGRVEAGCDAAQIALVEAELAAMSPEDLRTVCIDPESTERLKLSELADGMLNTAFDG